MDALMLILSVVCFITAILGCILPMLPGTPLAYLGILCLHVTHSVEFTTAQLISWALLVIVSLVLDYVVPPILAKHSGGTRWGTWGCIVGTIAGIFFTPWGLLLGPFLGAFIGELLGRNDTATAIKSGVGSLLGFLVGTGLKLIICIYLIIEAAITYF